MPKNAAYDIFDYLSNDACAVAMSWFGMMAPGRGKLDFQMVEHEPTPRAQAALDELVKHKVIQKQNGPTVGSIRYTALMSGAPFLRWYADHMESSTDLDFQLIQKIKAHTIA